MFAQAISNTNPTAPKSDSNTSRMVPALKVLL